MKELKIKKFKKINSVTTTRTGYIIESILAATDMDKVFISEDLYILLSPAAAEGQDDFATLLAHFPNLDPKPLPVELFGGNKMFFRNKKQKLWYCEVDR